MGRRGWWAGFLFWEGAVAVWHGDGFRLWKVWGPGGGGCLGWWWHECEFDCVLTWGLEGRAK